MEQLAASQADASSFQDLLTAASPTAPALSFNQDLDTLLGCPDLPSDLPLDEALLLELERDTRVWTNAACQDIAEPTDANLLVAPSSISPERLLDPASSTSGHPAAAQHSYKPPSPSTTQNLQQSGQGWHGLFTPGPQARPVLNLSPSSQAGNDRRSYLAQMAGAGPTPKPSIHEPGEGHLSDACGAPELIMSLPRSSLDQPGGWRISAAHSSYQAPAAAGSYPSNQAVSAPLPSMPIQAPSEAVQLAQPPAISGPLPPQVAQQLAVGQALLRTGQQQLPPSGLTPPAPRFAAAAAAAAISPAMPPALRLPHVPPATQQASAHVSVLGPASMAAPSLAQSLQVSQHHMGPDRPVPPSSAWECTSKPSPEGARAHKRLRRRLNDENAIGLRPIMPHQELAMAGALDDLEQATACSPGSLEAQQHALQGVALARGRHMSEVYELKQKNLQASQDPDSPAGQLFSKGACQSLAVAVCVLEMPHHSVKLCDEHLMKDSSTRRGPVTGLDIMQRLEMQLGGLRRSSVTLAQRQRAQQILMQHEAFTSRLEQMRLAVLQEMRHVVEAEDQAPAPQLLPSHILKLSDRAHTLSVLLGLAHESHLAAGRKLFLEILSPWQFGLIRACLYPVFSDVMYLLKFVAGDEPTSELPPLSDATVLPRFNKLQMQQQEE